MRYFILILAAIITTIPAKARDLSFDAFDITGMAVAMDAPQWSSSLNPQPSPGLKKLVLSQPVALSIRGTQWLVRSPESYENTPIDLNIFPLAEQDINCALVILKNEYIQKYVSCLREAATGRGSEECAKKLVDLASAEPNKELREFLQANLGAKITSLAVNNKAWGTFLNNSKSPELQQCLTLYDKLENNKLIKMANGISRDSPALIDFTKSNTSIDKKPFSNITFATHTPKSKTDRQLVGLYAWASTHDTVHPVGKDKPANLFTYHLADGQVVVLSAHLSGADVISLKSKTSMQQVVDFANEKEGEIFVSVAGLESLGLIKDK